MDKDFKNLVDYARGGAPPADHPVPRQQPTVVPLVRSKEPTLQDEILDMLCELHEAIRLGKVLPCHLIMGWGEATAEGGEPATHFIWDTTGLTRFELIGHLQTYACKLVNGEGE